MEAGDGQRIIVSILSIFARKKPIALLEQVTAQELVCYMDGLRLDVDRSSLRTWFRYMHAMMRKRQISVDIDIGKIETIEPRRYDVTGSVMTRQQGGKTETRPFTVSYLIENGRISGIWSTRGNYVGIIGRSIALPLYAGYMYHCLRAWCYRSSSAA